MVNTGANKSTTSSMAAGKNLVELAVDSANSDEEQMVVVENFENQR